MKARNLMSKVVAMKELNRVGDFPSSELEMFLNFESCLRRSVQERIRNGFIPAHRPVIDEKSRVFAGNMEYRRWCEKNLPKWLGFCSAKDG